MPQNAEVAPARRYGERSYQPVTTTTNTTSNGLSWGKVAKGALIITAVAVVGVVGFQLGAAIFGTATGSAAFTSAATGAAQVGTMLSTGFAHLAAFAVGALQSIGIVIPSATSVAAPVAAAGTTITTAGSWATAAVGSLAALTGLKTAMPALFVDTATHTTSTTTHAALPSVDHIDNSATHATLAKSTIAKQQVAANLDMIDVPDEMMHNANKAASKAAHYASEEEHHTQRNVAERAQKKLQSWAERVNTAEVTNNNVAKPVDRLTASPRPVAANIKPREGSFAEEITRKKEALSTALDQPVRA